MESFEVINLLVHNLFPDDFSIGRRRFERFPLKINIIRVFMKDEERKSTLVEIERDRIRKKRKASFGNDRSQVLAHVYSALMRNGRRLSCATLNMRKPYLAV